MHEVIVVDEEPIVNVIVEDVDVDEIRVEYVPGRPWASVICIQEGMHSAAVALDREGMIMARDAMQACIDVMVDMLRTHRDGWIDLPCGGSVLIEGGRPTRVSDKGSAIAVDRLLSEASQAVGRPVVLTGRFRVEPRSSEMTATVRTH